MMKKHLLTLSLAAAALCSAAPLASAAPANGTLFVEAESFENHGGWVLDTQFIDIMGSPYLMAHGMGKPVKDATTTVQNAAGGKYRVWIRTKNWVGPWDAPGAPGRFQVSVNGKALGKDFGTQGKDWLWEDGGEVALPAGPTKLSIHDLTGFNGRVDAILLTSDLKLTPPSEKKALASFRHKSLGLPNEAPETKEYDLVVVGGGYAGMGAAISGARQGLSVALVQNRPVLGGNGSSEVQVWAQGGTRRGLYPHLGEIVEEFTDRASNSPGFVEEYGDALKEKVVRDEKSIDLYLNNHVWKVEMAKGKEKKIVGAIALNTKTGEEKNIRGKFFVDCTGHGSLGALAEATFTLLEKGHLGMSNMWVVAKTEKAQDWPETPWALDLEPNVDFPVPKQFKPLKNNAIGASQPAPDLSKFNVPDFLHGEWFWESGFNKHPIEELELVRDWNLRALFGAFSGLRKQDPAKYANHAFQWVAYVGGTRESRLLIGDVVLNENHIVSGKQFPDGCVPTTWDIDLHYPKEQYMTKYKDNPFISRAAFGKGVDRKNGYPIPYRSFYSKNIENLFMAGRCISVDHSALGTIRVMRTCGMMGEVVGKAAYLTVRHQTTPRGVYEQYLDNLKELMRQPGAMRRDNLEGQLYMPANAAKLPEIEQDHIESKKLEGLIIDDEEAELTGNWSKGEGLKPYVDKGYQYTGAAGASARFAFSVKETGTYEVRIAWQPHKNRGTTVPVSVLSADGQKDFAVDQSKPAELKQGFHSLGKFKFEAGAEAAVTFRTDGAKGNVHLDAVQVLPVK